jgi:hypothetical protein
VWRNETTIFQSTTNTVKEATCTLYFSHNASVWLRPYKEEYSLAAATEGLGVSIQNRSFSERIFS